MVLEGFDPKLVGALVVVAEASQQGKKRLFIYTCGKKMVQKKKSL